MSLHESSPEELKARIEAERAGSAFLVLRDATGAQQIVALDPATGTATIGRSSSATIRLAWDRRVSRLHAEIACVNGQWTVSDDGLSSNGTFVGDERIRSRRRLHDGDQLTIGETRLTYRSPVMSAETSVPTVTSEPEQRVTVSAAQRRVALALCRPFGGDDTFPTAATNKEIAAELTLSVSTVKTHLRAMSDRFGLVNLPQNEQRQRLAERLLLSGVIGEHEL